MHARIIAIGDFGPVKQNEAADLPLGQQVFEDSLEIAGFHVVAVAVPVRPVQPQAEPGQIVVGIEKWLTNEDKLVCDAACGPDAFLGHLQCV